LCVLVLIAYLFDLTAPKTRIPSVILLLLLGWLMRQLTDYLNIHIPDLNPILPALGTIGLILIVLEGSLELELNRSKIPIVRKSILVALFPMLAMAFGVAIVLTHFGYFDFHQNLINIIPICVISSAIAIPSAKSLAKRDREFVIYESSISDILGVLFFNLIALNEVFDFSTLGNFFLQILLITLISFVATIGLTILLSRIKHHIKFVPIILLVILIYAISKLYHLPGLIFIMLFGLFLGNLKGLGTIEWLKRYHPERLTGDVHKFSELITEGTFLVRALFFLLFGYLINTSELLDPSTMYWSVGITTGIFLLRGIQLALFKLPFFPLLFIAPRGLITILLFLSIPTSQMLPIFSQSLILQVIIITAMVLMLGMIFTKKLESPKQN